MPTDPVCGMEVDADKAVATSEYQGKTYYFCAPGCKRRFDQEPDLFVQQPEEEEEDWE